MKQQGVAQKLVVCLFLVAPPPGKSYRSMFIGQQASPGLILVPQTLALGRTIEDLVLLWLASEDKEWINQICYLPL